MFSELGGVRRGALLCVYFFSCKLFVEQITAVQSTQNHTARTKGE